MEATGEANIATNLSQGVRAYMQQSRVFVGMVLILIFAEVLGLYGYAPLLVVFSVIANHASLIVALILNTRTSA